MDGRTVPSEPVFLYGALRSGTTLLRIMLAHHPDITCPGERDFIFDHMRPPAGNDLWRFDAARLSEDRIFKASSLAIPEEDDARGAARSLVGQMIKRTRGTLVVVVHRHLDRILSVFPRAKVIHLLRDPRDVAASSIGMGWSGNTYYGVDHWIRTERLWDQVSGDAGSVHELRYETLIADTEGELARLCAFLNVPFKSQMLEYSGKSTYGPPDKSLIFQWRRKQSPQNIALTEAKLGDMLVARGYEPSGHPAPDLIARSRLRLWLENRIGVWRFLHERYGLADVLQEKVARRLGLDSLRRAAQERIEAKVIQMLK